jgi:hypothetical protein
MPSFRSTVGPKQGTKPELVEGDEDGEAEAEDEDRDEEVAVGEDGSGSLGFVHRDSQLRVDDR